MLIQCPEQELEVGLSACWLMSEMAARGGGRGREGGESRSWHRLTCFHWVCGSFAWGADDGSPSSGDSFANRIKRRFWFADSEFGPFDWMMVIGLVSKARRQGATSQLSKPYRIIWARMRAETRKGIWCTQVWNYWRRAGRRGDCYRRLLTTK